MGNQISDNAREKVALLFQCLDSKGVGKLTEAQMTGLRVISGRFKQKTNRQLMKADKTGDGTVTRDEFIAYFIKKKVSLQELDRMCMELTKRLSSGRVQRTKTKLLIRRLKRRGRVFVMAINAFKGSILPKDALSYATFLPQIFLQRLVGTEFRCINALPIQSTFFGVTAFVDVSGFTALTESLARRGGAKGVQMLCAILDKFFARLVRIVRSYGGDIIKFAGDAMLILWRHQPKEGIASGAKKLSLAQRSTLAIAAVCCCCELQRDLSDYKATDDVILNIHVGVGCGELTEMVLGQSWAAEYIITGHPIKEMGDAEGLSHSKEVVVSPGVWGLVVAYENIRGTEVDPLEAYSAEPVAAADSKSSGGGGLMSSSSSALAAFGRFIALRDFRRELWSPLEASVRKEMKYSQVKTTDITRFKSLIPLPIYNTLRSGRHDFQSSMRSVTILFVNVRGLALTDRRASHGVTLQTAQIVMVMLQNIIKSFRGLVNKLMVDDKGVVLLAMFGLPPYTPKNTALPAALASLMISMQMEAAGPQLGLSCAMGITVDEVFCGVVGSPDRREYTVMGDAVNLAARLMGLACKKMGPEPGGLVLCNSTVNEKVRRVLQTKALAPVKLKGKTHPTQVFQVTGMKSRNSMLTTSRGGIGDVSLSTSQLARVRRTLILKFGAACDVILRGDGPVTAASPPGSPSPTPAGRRRVVVVRGIIGTGKTAMIPALLRVLANKDITTLVGSEIVVIKGVGVNAGQGISREASSSPFSAWRHTVKIVEERYMLNLLKYYKKNHKEDYAQLAEWFSVLIEWRGSAQSDFELLSELYEAKTAAARESAQNDGAVDGAGAGAGAAGNGRPKRESFFKRIGSMLTDAKEPSAAERLDLVKHSVRTRVGDLISQIYGHDAAKQKLVDKTRRDGLFSALRGIVGALDRLMRSEKKQLAIVLEDFHKFDVHSRRLFFDLPHSRHVHTIITSRPMIPFIKAQFDDAGIEPIFVDIGEIPESDSTGLIWGALNTDSKSPLIKHLAKMGEGNPLLIAQWCAQAREQKLIDEYGVEVVAADPATLRMPPNLRHYYLALYDALGPTKQGILRLLTLSKCDLSSKQIRECIDSKGRRNAQIYQNHCQVLEKMKILTRYHRRAEEVNGSAKASAAGGTKTGARTRTPPPAPPRRGSTVIPTTSQRRAGGPPPPPRRRRRQSLRAATAIVVSYQLKSQNLRMVIRDMLLDKQKDSIEKKLQEVVPESHPLPGKEVKPHHRRRTMPLHSISQEIEL